MQWQFCKYFKNQNQAERHLPACRRRHAAAAADRFSPLSRTVTRSKLRGELVRELSTPGAFFPAINRNTTAVALHFPLCSAPPPNSSAARRSHRRTASVMPSYANMIASTLRSSSACSRRLCWPESPGATRSSPRPAGAPPPSTSPWPGRSSPSPSATNTPT